jgi:hypothetical protein
VTSKNFWVVKFSNSSASILSFCHLVWEIILYAEIIVYCLIFLIF